MRSTAMLHLLALLEAIASVPIDRAASLGRTAVVFDALYSLKCEEVDGCCACCYFLGDGSAFLIPSSSIPNAPHGQNG
jgi:hypothetical protein